MTNGEKIQTILNVDRDCTEVHGENGTMTFVVTQDWWNAEYKNDKVDCEHTDCNNCVNHKYCDYESSSSGFPNKSEKPISSDCVDRHSVDMLAYRYLREATDNHVAFYEDFLDLPSVTPQEPRWIPVSERLPEIQNYSGNYLVTLKSGGVHIGMFIERNGKHWWTHYDDVVAWMPLPKVYKAEREDI